MAAQPNNNANNNGVPFLAGAAVGLASLPGLLFNINAEYTCCLLCGAVYQSDLDRTALNLSQQPVNRQRRLKLNFVLGQARLMRRDWIEHHATRSHTEKEHAELKSSGQLCTPKAALKLVPLGIAPLQPNDEVASAMLEAPRAPRDDVQGT